MRRGGEGEEGEGDDGVEKHRDSRVRGKRTQRQADCVRGCTRLVNVGASELERM